MTKKKQFFCSNKSKFLGSYDLINKYALKSFFNVPKLKTVSLAVSSKNLNSLLNENQSFLNKFFFLVFFFFTSNKSFLISNNSIKSKTSLLKENEDFLIQNIISDKILLADFQKQFYRENLITSFLKKNIDKFEFILKEETLKIKFEVPFSILHDFYYLLTNLRTKSDFKEGNINFTFTFTNITKKTFEKDSVKKFFKNFSFLWLI